MKLMTARLLVNMKSLQQVHHIKLKVIKLQRGDTLSSIATKSKISLAELAELNNLKANSHVQLGQTLKVPAGASVP